jgi:hypothetical protein
VGTDFWGNALFTLPAHQHLLNAEWLDTGVKRVPLVGATLGAITAARLFTAPAFLPVRTAAVSFKLVVPFTLSSIVSGSLTRFMLNG